MFAKIQRQPRWFIAAIWLHGLLASIGTLTAAAARPSQIPIILISIDTLRADHLGCYGYKKLSTPQIDSLARGGTVFSNISSQIPITLPSHVSLFTSTYPFANGIQENAQVLPPGAVTLATVLTQHGYNTAAFIGGYFLARKFGFNQGFRTYDSTFESRTVRGALDLKRPAAQVLGSATSWLKQNSDHPFFVFIHLFDLHEPYDPPPSYRARAPQSEYDEELAYVDDSLGAFFQYLANSGIRDRALIVLLSDHGESLGDHGESTHGYFVYRSTLHVPLVIHWPSKALDGSPLAADETFSAVKPPAQVDMPAGLIDVAPTLLSFLGIQSPPSFCGRSLLDLVRAEELTPREVYSESSYAHDTFGWASLRSLQRGTYQYVDAPHPELYDLISDPGEMHNLLPGSSALGASYREALQSLMATYKLSSAPLNVTRDSAEALGSLGYLHTSSPKTPLENSAIDPKDRVFEYRRYLMAGHLARTGKAEEASSEFAAMLADDPKNLPAYIELARTEIGLHRYLDAANQLKSALALDFRNVEAEEMLGDIWLTIGNLGRAAAEFQRLLTFAPQDYEAHYGLGFVASSQGRLGEAENHLRAAIAARPRSAEAHYQLGRVFGKGGRRKDAAHEFQTTLEINPNDKDARRELAGLKH